MSFCLVTQSVKHIIHFTWHALLKLDLCLMTFPHHEAYAKGSGCHALPAVSSTVCSEPSAWLYGYARPEKSVLSMLFKTSNEVEACR